MTIKNFVAGMRSNNGVVDTNQITLKNVPTISTPSGKTTLDSLADVISRGKSDKSTVVWEEDLGFYVVEPMQLDWVEGNIDGGNYDGVPDTLARVIKIKTSNVAGAIPNGSFSANASYIQPGELAYNIQDNILYSSNGFGTIIAGANQVNMRVSGTLTVANLAPTTLYANGSYGNADQILSSDGAGNISWKTPPNATPLGPNTSVQYNDGGTFNGSSNFTYDEANSNLFVANTITSLYSVANTLLISGGVALDRPANPENGTLWFDQSAQQLQIYLLNNWVAIVTNSALITEDFGGVNSAVTSSDNYGLTSDPITDAQDFGSI